MTYGFSMSAAQLTALGDPTRREVFELLRSGPQAVGDLAARLPVSRPAVSQHLKVLAEAGLVSAQAHGTRRVYSVQRSGLEQLRAWIDAQWDGVMDSFAQAAEAAATREDP